MTDTIDERLERYYEFLKSKLALAPDAGFEPPSPPSDSLLPHAKVTTDWAIRKGRAAIFASFGLGKALRNGTNVLTLTGWVPIESLNIGDAVIGSDGKPCNVTGVFPQGVRPIYRMKFSDRTTVDCDQDHLWYVQTQGQRYRGAPGTVLTTQQLIEKRVETLKGGSRLFIPLVKPVEFEEKELEIAPYTLGVLLGDGGLSRGSINVTTDKEIIEKVELPVGVIAVERKVLTSDVSMFSLVGENALIIRHGNPLMKALKALGLEQKTSLEKSIPSAYLFSSVEQRLKLLQGLLDTDGCPNASGLTSFSSSSKQLALDTQFLVESLGGTASLGVTDAPKYVHNGESRTGSPSYQLTIKLPPQFMPFTLQRKIERQTVAKQRPNPHRAIEQIDYIGEFEATCISVDSEDSLFVTEHCIVTHNTRMQLQLMRWVHEQTDGQTLIVAPLGVRQEFTINDSPPMGMSIEYCKTNEEVKQCRSPFIITNYERVRDGNITVDNFSGCTLDESSVLRSFGSKTSQIFFDIFRPVSYRFVATATPSPNEYKELAHYAHFLGVMDSGQVLTRFFQRDSKQAGNLTLMPHMENQFWLWVASWALFLNKPSDLGFSDEGYDLPPLNVHWHQVPVDYSRAWNQVDGWGQAKLFPDSSQGLQAASKERNATMESRVEKAIAIVQDNPDKHWIIWHDLEKERHLIEKLLPEAKTVYGSQDLEKREDLILGFSKGEYRILATKPSIAGSGCNFQRHCSDAIFIGPDYKFNDFIQAIHRIYRFLQTNEVNIHIIYAETQSEVVNALKQKWQRHNELISKMQSIVKKYGLNHSAMKMSLERTLGCDRVAVSGDGFTVVNNDTIPEAMRLESDSMDMILTSIPFSKEKTGFYEYTPSFNDLGFNPGAKPFFAQMDFLLPEWLRVLKPGRIAAIHTKDSIEYGTVSELGMYSCYEFSDDVVKAMKRHGFVYMGRITIDTDVVRENAQTYRLGWGENAKDSTKMGIGSAEYVLLFRKWHPSMSPTGNAYGPEPVVKDNDEYTRARWQIHASEIWRESGDRLLDPDFLKTMKVEDIREWWIKYSTNKIYDYEEHVKLCEIVDEAGHLPASWMLFAPHSKNPDIWTDIHRIDTLNSEQSRKVQEMHVCPLQLSVISRLIERFTNLGDTVYEPFAGIGSTCYQALKMGRKTYGVELNPNYFRYAVGYCERAAEKLETPTLFDLAEFTAKKAS